MALIFLHVFQKWLSQYAKRQLIAKTNLNWLGGAEWPWFALKPFGKVCFVKATYMIENIRFAGTS